LRPEAALGNRLRNLPPGDGWWLWRGPAYEQPVRLGDGELGAEAIVV